MKYDSEQEKKRPASCGAEGGEPAESDMLYLAVFTFDTA